MDVTFTPKNPPHAYTSNYEMHPAIGAEKLKALWQYQLLKLNIKFFLKEPQAVFGSEVYLLIFKFVKLRTNLWKKVPLLMTWPSSTFQPLYNMQIHWWSLEVMLQKVILQNNKGLKLSKVLTEKCVQENLHKTDQLGAERLQPFRGDGTQICALLVRLWNCLPSTMQ